MSPTRTTAPQALFTLLACLPCVACNSGGPSGAGAAPAADVAVPRPVAVRDAGAPADRMAARRVVTLYRWSSTEPGNASTNGDSIEHGTPRLHLVFEAHRDPQNRGWVTVSALQGGVAIPRSTRMRPLAPPTGEWEVPRDGYTEYSLEQFGGELRGDEPIQVLLASAPGERQTVTVGATPSPVRMPREGTLPSNDRAATGQFDAIAIALVPVNSRRGGRYLVYAVDMMAQPAGFAANGVMTHAPTAQEITRYAAWIRSPTGMGRDRDPPIAMQPIDR